MAHLKEAFRGMNILDMHTAHIQDWAATLTMADKSQADLLGELRFILRQAEWREDIKVALHAPTVNLDQKPIDWLLPEEQHAAFEKTPKVHQPIFATLFFYGMRPGEVCAAMWDQVNLSAHTFTISRTVSRRRIVERTKTSRQAATYPVRQQHCAPKGQWIWQGKLIIKESIRKIFFHFLSVAAVFFDAFIKPGLTTIESVAFSP